jgi:S-adenosylmethionine synthetase
MPRPRSGIAGPVCFALEIFGTEPNSRRNVRDELLREFDLRPAAIIETLDLERPIYYPTAA